MSEHFTIIIPAYSCKDWVGINLETTFGQKYSNYDVIYVDDHSPDHTAQKVREYIGKNPFTKGTFELLENPFNKGKMENMFHAVRLAKDGSIIVVVDGDDWLASDTVLSTLSEIYQTGDIWMTNGSYRIEPTKEIVTPRVDDNYWNGNIRSKTWEFSHLGTFKKELFCKIKRKDLMNKAGQFWATTSDQAMMWPMAEMAGPLHFRTVTEVLYIYNRLNPLSDDRVNRRDQLLTEQTIRNNSPYARLNTL